MTWWLLLALAMPLHTGGDVRPLAPQAICSTRWGLDRRHVTVAMKRAVAQRYNVPESDWKSYEFDHLIPRELGGADSIDNLWPQPLTEAKRKDRIENLLHRRVCAGQIGLGEAQRLVRRWWDVR